MRHKPIDKISRGVDLSLSCDEELIMDDMDNNNTITTPITATTATSNNERRTIFNRKPSKETTVANNNNNRNSEAKKSNKKTQSKQPRITRFHNLVAKNRRMIKKKSVVMPSSEASSSTSQHLQTATTTIEEKTKTFPLSFIQSDLQTLSDLKQNIQVLRSKSISLHEEITHVIQRMNDMDNKTQVLHEQINNHLVLVNAEKTKVDHYSSQFVTVGAERERIEKDLIEVQQRVNGYDYKKIHTNDFISGTMNNTSAQGGGDEEDRQSYDSPMSSESTSSSSRNTIQKLFLGALCCKPNSSRNNYGNGFINSSMIIENNEESNDGLRNELYVSTYLTTNNETFSVPKNVPLSLPSARIQVEVGGNSFSTPSQKKDTFFIRVNDLNIPTHFVNQHDVINPSNAMLSSIIKAAPGGGGHSNKKITKNDFYSLDPQKGISVIIDALLDFGLQCVASNHRNDTTSTTASGSRSSTMQPLLQPWKPNDDTKKTLAKRKTIGNVVDGGWISPQGKEILVWSSKFLHENYGSDLPVVKARGIVQTSPRTLVELLLDSNRVNEYNKLSLGRTDICFFQEGLDYSSSFPDQNNKDESIFRGEVKVICSKSKPPVVKNIIELVSLMCAREIIPGKDVIADNRNNMRGFLVVTRAVIKGEENDGNKEDAQGSSGGSSKGKKKKNAKGEKSLKSEMLLGLNFVRYIDDDVEESCSRAEFTTLTQIYSPMVPMIIGKRIGLSSAVNFIRDIQAIYS